MRSFYLSDSCPYYDCSLKIIDAICYDGAVSCFEGHDILVVLLNPQLLCFTNHSSATLVRISFDDHDSWSLQFKYCDAIVWWFQSFATFSTVFIFAVQCIQFVCTSHADCLEGTLWGSGHSFPATNVGVCFFMLNMILALVLDFFCDQICSLIMYKV